MKRKVVAVLLVLAAITGSVQALDQGSILLSPGFSINLSSAKQSYNGSSYSLDTTGIGGALAVDYVLSAPITLGGEVGFENYSIASLDLGLIPIMFRAAWHPDFGIDGLDPYVLGKAGVGIPLDRLDIGFGFGADLGIRYFFTDMIGAYAELGYGGIFSKATGTDIKVSLGGFTGRFGITVKF
jgi:hypothetical protein